MLNAIWLGMIFVSVIVGVSQGRIDQVVNAVTDSAKLGFEIADNSFFANCAAQETPTSLWKERGGHLKFLSMLAM